MRRWTLVLILTTLLVGCDKKDPDPPLVPSARAPPAVATAPSAATVAPEAPAAAPTDPAAPSASAEGHFHHGPGHEGKPGEHRHHPE